MVTARVLLRHPPMPPVILHLHRVDDWTDTASGLGASPAAC
jgi:hypothetical protein